MSVEISLKFKLDKDTYTVEFGLPDVPSTDTPYKFNVSQKAEDAEKDAKLLKAELIDAENYVLEASPPNELTSKANIEALNIKAGKGAPVGE